MLELMIAAALLQAQDPCNAADRTGPAPAASCPAWRSVARSPEAETWLDPASVRRDGAGVEVRTRLVFAAADESGVRSAVMRHRYDCTRRTGATLHVTLYDAAGAPLGEQAQTGADAAPAIPEPDSPSAAVLAALCPR
jgi:hypothetical protein